MNNGKGNNKSADEAVSEKDLKQKENNKSECKCTEDCPVDTPDGEELKEKKAGSENAGENSGTDETADENNAGDNGDEKKTIRTLKAELKKLREENRNFATTFAELEDRYLRMIAEYDNFRRRAVKERESAYTDAYSDALKEILPAIDNLERALSFANAERKTGDKMTEGVIMTLNQFNEALSHMGIVAVGAKGDIFNPEFHNAVMHEEDDTKGVNEIDEVFQKGYKRDEKVIRYAMVKVVN